MPRPTVSLLAIALLALAGCGGGGPKSDQDAAAQMLKDAAKAVADRDGDKACGYLTPDAQRQLQLQVGAGVLGSADCGTLVNRATLILTPLDKKQIEALEPSNLAVSASSGSATMATQTGAAPGQGMSVHLSLQKVGGDWKISGFGNAVGVPGA